MSEQHTPGPWEWSWANWRNEIDPHGYAYVAGDFREGNEDDPGRYCTGVTRVEGNDTSREVTEANARRIVAAVNACEGIQTADLTPGCVADLRRQRDALRAALKRVRDYLTNTLTTSHGDGISEAAVESIRNLASAALAAK